MLDKLRAWMELVRADVDALRLELSAQSSDVIAREAAALVPPGADGADGAEGPRGPQGEPGDSITGERGPQGEPGDSITGERGPKGDPGDSVRGEQGLQGEAGESVRGRRGPKGDQGIKVKGERGEQGPPGKDGAGVTGVRLTDNELHVSIDGQERSAGRIELPEPVRAAGGGGLAAASRFTDMPLVEITFADSPYSVNRSQTIFADATAGPIVIDLPASAALANRLRVETTKIDASANAVRLDGNGAMVVGAAYFDLTAQGENIVIRKGITTGWWNSS